MTQKYFTCISLLALLAFGAFLSGCSSGSGTNPPPTNSNVSPKTGSSYTYAKYQTDSSGIKIAGSDQTITAMVVADSQQMLGMTNVYTVVDGGDTAFLTSTSNNDAIVYLETNGLTGLQKIVGDAVFLHRWITLPITSHTSITFLTKDTSVLYQGASIPVHIVATSDYINDSTIHNVNGAESVVASQCKITVTLTSVLISGAVTYERHVYIAPKIGYIAQETSTTTTPQIVTAPPSKSGDFRVLTAYTLK